MDAAFSHTFCVTSTGKHTAAYINYALSGTGIAAAGNARKHQNIVTTLDNPAESGIINIEAIPREQREAVHRQADILERVGIWMRNRWPALSDGLREEMRAMYTPDQWALIDNKIDADEWENIQFAQMLKNDTAERTASVSDTDEFPQTDEDGNLILPHRRPVVSNTGNEAAQKNNAVPLAFWDQKEVTNAARQLQPFKESTFDDPNRQQLLQKQAEELDRLRWQLSARDRDPALTQAVLQMYQDYPEQVQVIMGRVEPGEWRQWQQNQDAREKYEKKQEEQKILAEDDRQIKNVNAIKIGTSPSWDEAAGEYVTHVPLRDRQKEISAMPDEKIDPKVAGFSDEDMPIFAPVDLPSIQTDEMDCPECELNISEGLQREIYNMCRIAGMDYYLALAIIAHESGSRPEGDSGVAQGLMQFATKYLNNYRPHILKSEMKLEGFSEEELNGKIVLDESDIKGTDHYRNNSVVAAICDHAMQRGADMDNICDPLASIAYGISAFVVHYNLAGGDLEQAIYGYAGPTLETAAREIMYYRDLLAEQDGQKPWNFWQLDEGE